MFVAQVIMSKIIAAVVMLAGIGYGIHLYLKYRVPPKINPIGMELTELDGTVVDWSEFEGKAVLVNYWQTWCPPCREEMPDLEAASKALAPHGIEVIVVSDEPVEKLNRFRSKFDYSLRYLRTESLAELGVHTYPTTFLFRPDGSTAWDKIGPDEWASPEMLEKLKSLAAGV